MRYEGLDYSRSNCRPYCCCIEYHIEVCLICLLFQPYVETLQIVVETIKRSWIKPSSYQNSVYGAVSLST
jgi:hypothetical protein